MIKYKDIPEVDSLLTDLFKLPYDQWPVMSSKDRNNIRLWKFRHKHSKGLAIGKKLQIIKLFGYSISFTK